MELSDEMLKIIELIKAGEVNLVEQLLKGNPELCSDSSNEMVSKVYLAIWPNSEPRINWYNAGQEDYNIKKWMLWFAKLIKVKGYND